MLTDLFTFNGSSVAFCTWDAQDVPGVTAQIAIAAQIAKTDRLAAAAQIAAAMQTSSPSPTVRSSGLSFLGMPLHASHIFDRIPKDGLALSGYVPASCHTAGPSWLRKEVLIFVDPSPVGVAALARLLGFSWARQIDDIKRLAEISGRAYSAAQDPSLSPVAQTLLTVFSLLPQFGSHTPPQDRESLAIVPVFLRSLDEGQVQARARATLTSWIEKRKRLSAQTKSA